MFRTLLLLAGLMTALPHDPARADLAYRFDITTAFAASDPFPNQINNDVYPGGTGYLQIMNDGPGIYGGIVRIVALSGNDGDLTFTIPNVFLAPGASLSLGMPFESNAAGGFNSFTGAATPSVPNTFRPGIILYMEGSVAGATGNGAIKIGMQDLDAVTGVTLTDPNGYQTFSFVLQGGDPFGLNNGDAWALNLTQGHVTLAGIAVAEPPQGFYVPVIMAALLLARGRKNPLPLAKRTGSR